MNNRKNMHFIVRIFRTLVLMTALLQSVFSSPAAMASIAGDNMFWCSPYQMTSEATAAIRAFMLEVGETDDSDQLIEHCGPCHLSAVNTPNLDVDAALLTRPAIKRKERAERGFIVYASPETPPLGSRAPPYI
jgi:hypothetical protein